MKPETLEIKAALQILKPAHEVFEAIINPDQMSNYFILESTGKMEEGSEITWRWPEFDVDSPIRVGKIVQDKYVSYYWGENMELFVEISLEPWEKNATVVTVTEKSMKNDEAGINWLKGNTEGWANFLACLKAWLEYGVHLRKGAFEFRKNEFKNE
jgi:uncharacterized protein YndB with AHSA1/START domain